MTKVSRLATLRYKRAARTRARRSYVGRVYGLTLEEYRARVAAQDDCEVCDKPFAKGQQRNMDHDHSTGKVRGILCASCNQGLGRFKDKPHVLRAAASYLELHRGG